MMRHSVRTAEYEYNKFGSQNTISQAKMKSWLEILTRLEGGDNRAANLIPMNISADTVPVEVDAQVPIEPAPVSYIYEGPEVANMYNDDIEHDNKNIYAYLLIKLGLTKLDLNMILEAAKQIKINELMIHAILKGV